MIVTEIVTLQKIDEAGVLLGMAPLTLRYVEEPDGRWTGECLELGTPAYADSFGEVAHQLKEAVELQISEMDELGYIDSFLQEHNVRLLPAARPSTPHTRWGLVGSGQG